jgi:WD40 repeat protein
VRWIQILIGFTRIRASLPAQSTGKPKAKNNSFVLRGVDLRAAEQWLAQAGTNKERQPTALQTEYIIASRKAAARRQRLTLGAVTFGFVVAVVLAVLAFRQSELARAKELEVRKTFSRSDFFRADELVSGQKRQEALAFLARAVRSDQDNHAAGRRILFLLMQHPWFVPEANAPPSVEKPSPSSPGSVKLTTAAMNKIEAALVQNQPEVGDDSTKNPEAHADESLKKAVFSPSGERAAIRFGRRIYVFDVATGDEVASQEDAISSTVRFSPDGSRLVVVGGTTYELGNAGEVYINALDGGAPKEFHFTNVIHSPEFSPDGHYFVTVCLDQTAQLWKINGDRLATFPVTEAAANNWPGPGEDGQGRVRTVHFSSDGRRLTIGETSWVLVGRQPVFKMKDEDDMANVLPRSWAGYSIHDRVIAESVDGQLIVTAPLPERKEPLEITHVNNRKRLILVGSEGFQKANFTPDGSRLVALSEGRGGVWDTGTGALLGPFQFKAEGGVRLRAVTADRFVVLTGTKAQVWNLASRTPVGPALEHQGTVYYADFHPDGRRLVTATKDNSARIWDIQSGTPLTDPVRLTQSDNLAYFAPAGDFFVTESVSGGTGNGDVQIWDTETGRPLCEPISPLPDEDNSKSGSSLSM